MSSDLHPDAGFAERICVVIPMYRVEDHIQKVVNDLPDWIWRVIVVDDQSPDRSTERVAELKHDKVLYVRHETNQGVGGAMISGYSKAVDAGATILVKVDGDGQMPLEYLLSLVQPILDGRADYVKGNRFARMRELKAMPFVRRVGNLGLSFLTKLASGYWNVFDPTNGFTALDASVYQMLDPRYLHPRYFFETSMLVELSLARAAVTEVAMPAKYLDETSSLSILRTVREFPILLLKSFLRRLWLQYFVIDFSAASLFLATGILAMVAGSIWGAAAWSKSIVTGIPATTGTVMIAVLPFILGFQLILQAVVLDIQNIPRHSLSLFAQKRKRRCLEIAGAPETPTAATMEMTANV